VAETLTMVAPAKVNLYLGIGSRRSDGYHEVVTVLQALELHDTVTVSQADRLEVFCVPDIGLPPCDNIAAVAARVLGGIMDREPKFDIRIEKRIPAGGGLGGGSADAAATLLAVATLWGIDPADERLLSAAASVGADVPFFLDGGTALFGNRGDQLVRTLPTVPLDIAIVNMGVPASTGVVYAAVDRTPRAEAPGPAAMAAALEAGDRDAIVAALHNDMTVASVALVPPIGEALAWASGLPGVLGTCLAGSGSSVFAVCEDADAAEAVAAEARDRGWWGAATRTRPAGVTVERTSS
jgi:4-diphosphocytidyl-2-C-methyl-D-erythritol kinase